MQPLLDINQASEILNTPKQTIYKWKRQNRLGFIKLGKRLLFSLTDLETFIEAHRTYPKV